MPVSANIIRKRFFVLSQAIFLYTLCRNAVRSRQFWSHQLQHDHLLILIPLLSHESPSTYSHYYYTLGNLRFVA